MNVRLQPKGLLRLLFSGWAPGRLARMAGVIAGWMLCSQSLGGVALSDDPRKAQVYDSGVQQVSLLELYSSQGCKNCPPAERWMTGLKTDGRLWQQFVPVVFHVDYWDSLGWQDPYSTLKHSQRQRMYLVHGYSKAVYTPGFMLAGEEWTGWFQAPKLPELPKGEVGQLRVDVTEGKAVAKFVRPEDSTGLVLNVAVLGFDIVTEVTKGRNKGLQLPQDFVVLNYKTYGSDIGLWRVDIPATDFQGCAAVAFWVSQNSDPTPIQATGGWYRLPGAEDVESMCALAVSD